jgi:outer membrane receptor protein involved in Fe transport
VVIPRARQAQFAAVAIDDPTVGPGDSVYAPSYYRGVASLSYTFKLKQGRSLQIDFNVDNLFDRREPIYGSNGGVIGITPSTSTEDLQNQCPNQP